jgi:uncharacterized membrane protein
VLARPGAGYRQDMDNEDPTSASATAKSESPFEGFAEAVEGLDGLDPVAGGIASAVDSAIPPGAAKAALNGSWLGHSLHPLLTDVVVGSFMSATFLDVLGGKGTEKAANRLVGVGLAAYAPTALTGLSDWSDRAGDDPAIRRTGLVHATTNAVGASLYAASAKARASSRARGALLGLAGFTVMGAGAFLGGHLTKLRGLEPLAPSAPAR